MIIDNVSTLLAHVKIREGFEDHWESIARRVFTATHANENGCVRYEYWRGSQPRCYYVLLSFETFDDFMVHQVADYHHNTDFQDCFEEFKLEWVDPIKGASPLQESDTGGAVRQDKSDIWNEYVKNHSADLPQWWVEQRK